MIFNLCYGDTIRLGGAVSLRLPMLQLHETRVPVVFYVMRKETKAECTEGKQFDGHPQLYETPTN